MMNTQPDNQTSNMNNTSEQLLSVGKTLREAREQLGLSVNDVANRIKFAPRQIESLEADDYVRLPEAAFVRGFVRSYARLLELDPERLLTGLPTSHTQSSAKQEVRSVEIAMPTASSARRYNVLLLAAGLAIALVVAIFERMHDRSPELVEPVVKTNVQVLELPSATTESGAAQSPEQAQPQIPAPQPVVSPAPAPAPLPSTPQQLARTVPVPALQQPVPQQAVRAAKVPAPAQQPLPVQAVAAEPVPAVSANAAPVTAEQPRVSGEINAPEHALRMEFDEDAWVEVKDGNGNILISKMRTKGSLVRVAGKAPLSVTIGNARAVRLFDNGKKINLERYTTADVAHVKLK
jgi:cytoskeleton protein RodZ